MVKSKRGDYSPEEMEMLISGLERRMKKEFVAAEKREKEKVVKEAPAGPTPKQLVALRKRLKDIDKRELSSERKEIKKAGGVLKLLGVPQIGKRKETAQEIVEGASRGYTPSQIAEITKRAKAGMAEGDAREKAGVRGERIEKFKSYFGATKKMPISVRRKDRRVGATARKAINLVAPKGFVKQLTRPKGAGKGRGRPHGTFKTRYVPGIGPVKVPTAVYNRMISEQKRKRRMAIAERQARAQQQYEAEQIAMSQDPRFQQRDSFLDAPDMEHEQEVMNVKQRMEQQQEIQQMQQQMEQEERPSMVSRAGRMFNNFGKISLMGTDRGQQVQDRQVPQIRRPDVQDIHRPPVDMNQHQPRRPQVLVASGKSSMFDSGGPSILGQGNEFNGRNKATIGFGR